MRAVLAIALLSTLLLAGCTSCVEGPPVTARGINNADASGGIGRYDLDIQVTDGPGGDILPDSGVVVYWESTSTEDWDSPAVRIGQDDVEIGPAEGQQTVEPTQTIRAKTDGNGMAFMNPPANRIVGVVVANDGFTEEWVPAAATGDAGDGDVLTVPLYRQVLSVQQNGTWGPGGASPGFVTTSNYDWLPVEAEFGAPGDSRRGYAARIVELQVTLTWENGIGGVGDLGIGIGNNPGDGPTYFHDNSENTAPGIQSETAILNVQELLDHNILGTVPIQIGPATKSGYVSPLSELAYTLDIDARFDSALADLKTCQGGANLNDDESIGVNTPGPAVPLLLAGLVAVAAIVRRRS